MQIEGNQKYEQLIETRHRENSRLCEEYQQSLYWRTEDAHAAKLEVHRAGEEAPAYRIHAQRSKEEAERYQLCATQHQEESQVFQSRFEEARIQLEMKEEEINQSTLGREAEGSTF